MDDDFLLENDVAKMLFHEHSERLPIIDYHCHIPAREIYEDRRFESIEDLWLGGLDDDGCCRGDHYKWRLMRANGAPEEIVTGKADGEARFAAFADALSLAIGNPMYHWCNLELKKYFGINEPLTPQNAGRIRRICNDMLKCDPSFSPRGIIKKSNVVFIGTTDDPVDDLSWHKKIASDKSIGFTVRPSFRPDRALNINATGFSEYIGLLAHCTGKENLSTTREVTDALIKRVAYFADHGCVAADHGLVHIPYRRLSDDKLDRILAKALSGEKVSRKEEQAWQTQLLTALGREYHKRGIAMELHYSCARDVNEKMFGKLGPNSGYDMMADPAGTQELARFLSELDRDGQLPKTIIFSLDPSDNAGIGTLIGCFQSEGVCGKIQQGAAWWFNDTKEGIIQQMRTLAGLSILGNFIGMLTDSRSFLSYARHDYFRRIMCNLIGSWVEAGLYPYDEDALLRITEGISFYNAQKYFDIKNR